MNIRFCIYFIILKAKQYNKQIVKFITFRMFCCSNPNHQGQIVTSICQKIDCAQKQNQLCCNQCILQEHNQHQIVSMKKLLPQLLNANNDKRFLLSLLNDLILFLQQEFSQDEYFLSIAGGKKLTCESVSEVIKLMMSNLKKRNRQQNKKIKEIEKTLKLSNEFGRNSSPEKYLQPNYQSVLLKGGQSVKGRNLDNIPLSRSQIQSLQTFSHTLKHPYITLSPDTKTAMKTSHAGGYKLAALSASAIPTEIDSYFFNVKIGKSSGNILIGLAIPEIIRDKQYLNCYGSGQGGFLIGQNGNDPLSSILFHHSDNIFNRKQIVGWNFKEGEILGVGVIKQQETELVSFRKYHMNSNGKPDYHRTQKQFTMPLWGRGAKPMRLHLVAILQNLNDSVQIISSQQ